MKEESNILEELVRAKGSIKRKYTTLKTGEADVQQLMTQTFKPIIDPLTKISNTRDLYNNQTRKEDVRIDSEIINTNESNNYDNYQLEIENWFQSKDIDKTFGPKKIVNNDITLGDKEVKFTRNLQDYTGKPIAGCFYSEEIHKTNHRNEYLIEKIIRRKGNQVFVKWL
ncbi:uncharacterized protein LOC126555819 [Aphis gossypii]|uniref:uncharacterized protein LOC126555819 n=1 Tax=Aphis gossypii TaxID=80765 RepID=UPI002159A3B7|nr:uncharacterized protein LOC126555819 [Aphis gossypii]